MYYIEPEALSEHVFLLIYDLYSKAEQVPRYEDEVDGINKYISTLFMVRSDLYYPSLLDKATYLFLQINQGHFFSNGNKRLALVSTLIFLAMNDSPLSREHSREEHEVKLHELFAGISAFEDGEDFFSEEFGLYNLSIIVADSHKYIGDDFDNLKMAVREYLDFATHPMNTSRLEFPWAG